jgi:membrane protein required for colicin V production
LGTYAFLAVDLGIIAVVVVSGLLAYARGFARELVTVGALGGAAAVTYFLFDPAMDVTRKWIAAEQLAAGITIAGLFAATLVAVLLVGHPLAGRIGGSNAGPVDHWLGLVFGFMRGSLIVVILYMLLAFAMPAREQPEWLREAKLLPVVEELADWLLDLVPPSLREDVVLSAADAAAPRSQGMAATTPVT